MTSQTRFSCADIYLKKIIYFKLDAVILTNLPIFKLIIVTFCVGFGTKFCCEHGIVGAQIAPHFLHCIYIIVGQVSLIRANSCYPREDYHQHALLTNVRKRRRI